VKSVGRKRSRYAEVRQVVVEIALRRLEGRKRSRGRRVAARDEHRAAGEGAQMRVIVLGQGQEVAQDQRGGVVAHGDLDLRQAAVDREPFDQPAQRIDERRHARR